MSNLFRFAGTIWKNCGDTAGQKAALTGDQNLSDTLRQSYAQTFGQNQALFSNLTQGLQKISNAGVGQQGETPEELAAKNSQNINASAASNQKLQTAIGENAAGKGISGAPGVESGIVQAERAQAATDVDTAMNNRAADITKENYDIGRQNYWAATTAQPAIASELESADTSAANAATGANQVTGAQANANAQSSTGVELLGLGTALAGDAATIGSAALGQKKNS